MVLMLLCVLSIIILKLQLCVCSCATEGYDWKLFDHDSKRSFSLKAIAGCYMKEPTNTASKSASSRPKEAHLQSMVQK